MNPGDRVVYIGHTTACAHPKCYTGWSKRIGKIGTVKDTIESDMPRIQWDDILIPESNTKITHLQAVPVNIVYADINADIANIIP